MTSAVLPSLVNSLAGLNRTDLGSSRVQDLILENKPAGRGAWISDQRLEGVNA